MEPNQELQSTQQTVIQRLQQAASQIDGYGMLNQVKAKINEKGSQFLDSTRTQIVDLTTNQQVPNYKVSAAASIFLGLLSLSASLENSSVTTYLALASCAGSALLSLEQYGVQKSLVDASSGVFNLFRQPAAGTTTETVPSQPKIKKSM